MSYEYINNEKVDLSRQDHRDEVIRRNKKFEKALKNGLSEYTTEVTVTSKLTCVKCGSLIQNSEEEEYEAAFEDLPHNLYDKITNIDCPNCDTQYIFNKEEMSFKVILPVSKIQGL